MNKPFFRPSLSPHPNRCISPRDRLCGMHILGVSKLSRDSAIALLDKESILAPTKEEKLKPLQKAYSFPRLAISRILEQFHLEPSNLSAIAVADLPPSKSKKNSYAHAAFQQLRHLLSGSRRILRLD